MTRAKNSADDHAEEDEPLTAQVNVRMSPRELEELDELCGLAPRSLIAREALKIGMEVLRSHPERLKQIKPHRRARRKRSSRES